MAEVSFSSTLYSGTNTNIENSVQRDNLKTLSAKKALVSALIFGRRAHVREKPGLEGALSEYFSSIVQKEMYEIVLPLLNQFRYMQKQNGSEIPDDCRRKLRIILHRMQDPNYEVSEIKTKIANLTRDVSSEMTEVQKAIEHYKNKLRTQTEELEAKANEDNSERSRLKKKINKKLASIAVMKALTCNLLSVGNMNFVEKEEYVDIIKTLRKPSTFYNL